MREVTQFPIKLRSRSCYKILAVVAAFPMTLAFAAKPQQTDNSAQAGKQESTEQQKRTDIDINAKIAQLDIDNATLADVIRVFGEPTSYGWGGKKFDKDNLPANYILLYPRGFSVVMGGGRITELRHERPGDYMFRDRLRVGSSLDEVLELIGQPKETVEGKPNGFKDGVLYKNIDGKRGFSYYSRTDQRVRFFFMNDKVVAIYVAPPLTHFVPTSRYWTLLSPEGSLAIVRKPQAASFQFTKLPMYDPASTNGLQVDLRGGDVSAMDLQGRHNDLMRATFDDRTIWPAELHDGFDPKQMMNLGRNPGLGIRELHQRGIVGKGIGIGIIDQGLLVDHEEYRDRLRLYEEIHSADYRATMHGAAVSSIAVGKTVGVAPAADLYFIAETHGTSSPGSPFEWDFQWTAKSIDRLLEINRTLPPDRKIRVISLSVGWSPLQKGYAEVNQAVERATKENVFVISTSLESTHKLAFHGLGRDPLKDPDDVQNYGPGFWWRERFFKGADSLVRDRWFKAERPRLMVPMDSRCVASPCGSQQYVFYAGGGWSWSVPYLAGLYALACEVKPTVTPEEFWSVGLKTGKTVVIKKDGKTHELKKIVDPTALVRALTEK